MQFVLFDVTATLVFLVGYLAVVALSRMLSREPRLRTPPRREWPRLSYPR